MATKQDWKNSLKHITIEQFQLIDPELADCLGTVGDKAVFIYSLDLTVGFISEDPKTGRNIYRSIIGNEEKEFDSFLEIEEWLWNNHSIDNVEK